MKRENGAPKGGFEGPECLDSPEGQKTVVTSPVTWMHYRTYLPGTGCAHCKGENIEAAWGHKTARDKVGV